MAHMILHRMFDITSELRTDGIIRAHFKGSNSVLSCVFQSASAVSIPVTD